MAASGSLPYKTTSDHSLLLFLLYSLLHTAAWNMDAVAGALSSLLLSEAENHLHAGGLHGTEPPYRS